MRNRVAYLNEFLQNPKGSMTVEFVAFAPMLIAALVISFEFGRAFWAYDVVTRDLRAGVRYLSRDAAAAPPYASDVCPASALNIAQTGSHTDSADANKHFPWKGVSATFTCPVTQAFSGTQYNDAGYVIEMRVSVPLTLSLLQFIDRVTGSSLPSYPLRVSYQARYIGN